MTRRVTTSAPGSVMVMGEHAVVSGHPAMVAAIDQRVTVEITARTDDRVSIRSEIAEPQVVSLAEVEAVGPYRFLLAAILDVREGLSHGFEIETRSEIDPTMGLGSSAAVLCAGMAGLAQMTGRSGRDLHARALAIVRAQQGRGSGADLAASLQGGVLAYQLDATRDAASATRLPTPPQISLRYVGYKTPTGDVLCQVAKAYARRPAELDAQYQQMALTAQNAIDLAQAEDWTALGPVLTAYQGHMRALGVSDANLDALLGEAAKTDGMLGAKISGSGLGDCVLAMGAVPAGFTPVQIAQEGVLIHGDG